jgi:hypothetical protein
MSTYEVIKIASIKCPNVMRSVARNDVRFVLYLLKLLPGGGALHKCSFALFLKAVTLKDYPTGLGTMAS